MDRPTVAVDFDGVLNNYSGWQGVGELFEPLPGVAGFLEELFLRYRVVIYTTREPDRVWGWLIEHELDEFIEYVTNTMKPKAIAYIDDRAVRFKGSYSEVLDALGEPTWWE